MSYFSAKLSEAWVLHNDFTTPVVEETERLTEKPCVYAQRFSEQAGEMCNRAVANPSHVLINQTLLQVSKKYWEWYGVVPKTHRTCVEARGHRCIHAVFKQCYELLKALELSLEPPMLYLPTPPVPPPPPVVQTIAGITIGEVLGED